jgi:hypothetical protein
MIGCMMQQTANRKSTIKNHKFIFIRTRGRNPEWRSVKGANKVGDTGSGRAVSGGFSPFWQNANGR